MNHSKNTVEKSAELWLLEWLLAMAEEMRGMYVGHPDPDVLKEYDDRLNKAVLLIAKVRATGKIS